MLQNIFMHGREKFVEALEILSGFMQKRISIYHLEDTARLLKQIKEPKYSERVRESFKRMEAYNPLFYDIRKEWEDSL